MKSYLRTSLVVKSKINIVERTYTRCYTLKYREYWINVRVSKFSIGQEAKL